MHNHCAQCYAQALPAYHVSADDPPAFHYQRKLSFLVTRAPAIDYDDSLRAARIDAER